MRILQIVEESVFRPDQQIRNAIVIPIYDSRAGGMSGQDALVDHALITKDEFILILRNVAKEIDIPAVH